MITNVIELINQRVAANGDRPFLHFEGKDITYRELGDITNRTANGFLNLGLGKGDKVCLMLPNCLEFVYAWLGLVKMGAVEVPINIAHKGDMLVYLINDSDARVLVIDSRFLSRIQKIEDELTSLETLVVWEEEPAEAPVEFKRLLRVSFEDLYRGSPDLPVIDLGPGDEFCILYTSGTTGPSKGVVMPHRYVVHTAANNVQQLGCGRDDTFFICLPLFHGNAQLMGVMSVLAAQARGTLARRFSVGRFWGEVAACGATSTAIPGSVVSMLLKQPASPADRQHRLRTAFTAGTPLAVWKEFEDRFGTQIIEGYGSTECGMILMNTVEESRVGSVGKPAQAYQVAIVDDDDNQLGAEEVGEIVTRPEQPFCMMTWYYKMPAETLEACRNLWFHSGDYGRRDADGFYYYVDRKKDVIRRRGENISSFEVERGVNAHPKVLESAAIAVPDPMGEYELKVLVIPRPGADLTPEELIAFCEERMAKFMVPRYLEFRDSFPKTPTDRVEKFKLRQEGITENTWDRLKAQG